MNNFDDKIDHHRNLVGFRRAARHVVIHVHDLIERAEDRSQLWNMQLAFRHIIGSARIDLIRVFGCDRMERRMDDLPHRAEICQPRNAAFTSAGTECNEDLRLLP